MKKISIITISYNQEAFIKEAIDSVLDQGYENLEYIVIDAGSTDGSRAIIDGYGDKIVKLYEPDKGQADGLNKGLKMATGEIVGFVNSDDLLLENALHKVNEFFTRHDSLSVLFGSGYKVDESRRIIHDIYPDKFTIEKYACMAFNFIQTATFFKRDAVIAFGGFNLENRTCWDGELIAKLGAAGYTMKRTFAKLAAFRIYNNSISGSGANTDRYMADRARIFAELTGQTIENFEKRRKSIYLRFINFIETPIKLKVMIQKKSTNAGRKV